MLLSPRLEMQIPCRVVFCFKHPLRVQTGVVYAVAQGPVSIGGLTAGNGGGNIQVNHPTVGMVT